MSSPQIITTTASQIISFNNCRNELFLQNVGDEDIYFKKQIPNLPTSIPNETNYDFVLKACNEDDEENDDENICCLNIFKLNTIASFYAVTLSGTSKLAVMETNHVNGCLC